MTCLVWAAVFAMFVVVLLGYFLGCLNGSVLVSHFIIRDDVRQHGSGNAGLTNFYRTYGAKYALGVILLDMGKTVAACLIGGVILNYLAGDWTFGVLLGGLGSELGHMFPVFFGFKGGKGILSGAVLVWLLNWRVALIAWGLFALLWLTTRYVSLGSITAAVSMPVSTWFLCGHNGLYTSLTVIIAALVLWCMLKTDGCYHIVLKELRIHRDKLIRILKIGIPAGLQGAIFSISNVLIQSSINSFGSTAMAGNAAAVNIEGFVFTSCNSVAQASLTFTSQNLGAGQYKRLRGITLWCLALGILLSEILGFIAYGFGNSLLAFYNKDSEVIAMGMIRMMIVGTTYGLDAIMDIMADIIRGMGSSVMPMIVTLIGACGFRVVWIYTIFATHHDLRVLYISYPISWILTSLTHIICYFIVKRRRLSGLTEGVPSV